MKRVKKKFFKYNWVSKYRLFRLNLNGPTKWGSYEITSVRFSVCPEFYAGIARRKFLIFLHEVRVLYNLKIYEQKYWKKSCSGVFLLKGPKTGLKKGFSSFMKIGVEFFLLYNIKSKNWLQRFFGGEILFCSKEAKMGPNWGFSSFMKNWHWKLFWFYAYSVSIYG